MTAAAGTCARSVAARPCALRGGLIALVLLGVSACGSLGQHRVQHGETLYAISFRYGWDYRDVAEWNDLKPPYTIHPGQLLRTMPPDGGRGRYTADAAPAPAPVVAATAARVPSALPAPPATPPAAPPARAPSPAVTPPRSNAAILWRWPTAGSVLRGYADNDASRKGIDIGGTLGQPIRAAANGRVVYAGNGLLHYGNLVIIKHNENYLTAYGYNRQLRVNEGDDVVAGQHIADMGTRGNGEALLHFQIRYDGLPINPARYLPPLSRQK